MVRDPGAFIECDIDKFQHKTFETYVCVIVRFPSLTYVYLAKYVIFNTNEPLSHVFSEYKKRRRKSYAVKFITDYNAQLKTENVFTFPVIYVVLLT